MFKKTYSIGWGICGDFLSMIRQQAYRKKVSLKVNPPFLKLSPMNTVTIEAEGGDIEGFKYFMSEHEKVYDCDYE